MPEVVVRKRVRKRTGGFRYRLSRWFYLNRPRVAVAAAFAIVCLLAVGAVVLAERSVNDRPADESAASLD